MIKELKSKIRNKAIVECRSLFYKEEFDIEKAKETIIRILNDIIYQGHLNLSDVDRHKIINDILDEFTGFGPIEGIFKDPAVSEIMINGPKQIYIEKNGKKELTNIVFDDEQQLMALIYRILASTRRRIDESFPYTDVSFKDGSRVNIIIPPLALDGPIVTIRKFLKGLDKVDEFIKLNTLDQRMGDFLIACIKAKVNMIFSGATGSGKTTTLNMLSSYIKDNERIVTIEDTAELHLAQNHVVRLETRNPNIEGKGEVTIRDLFKNSLRMRPGRIILGEARGPEALDMLQAMCSGHRGALAVIHASSPRDVIYRLETMVLTSGIPINLEAVHRQIAAAINLIIQHEQLPDGTRKITHLTQVNGMKDGQIILDDIFVYEIEDVNK
ncbi:MAG: CpaF family protein, partial [Candidatus Omnitrophica bacterium]|nr:CpaF family protein [Candidatus Omnitrophota bacterium]